MRNVRAYSSFLIALFLPGTLFAGLFDSLEVRPKSVTIVEDPRFPVYARAEIELINRGSDSFHGEWAMGEPSEEFWLGAADTGLVRVYLWGETLKNDDVDTFITLKTWQSGKSDSQTRVAAKVEAKAAIHLDFLSAVKVDTAFKDEWTVSQLPHPFGGGTILSAFLPIPMPVEIKILDIEQNYLKTAFSAERFCGRLRHYNSDFDLPPGVYYLQLVVDGNVINASRIILIR